MVESPKNPWQRKEVIGIEPKSFDIACKRIDQAEKQGQIFQPQKAEVKQEKMF